MLTHPLIETLKSLKFHGMLEAYEAQSSCKDAKIIGFDERLSLLLENEKTYRENIRLKSRLKKAKLKQQACMEDIDYRHPRGLDKSLMISLATCSWIGSHRNVLITGPTGTGKTYVGEALAHKACMKGFTAHYIRLPRLFNELALTKADGRYLKWLDSVVTK